jgi:hypothetical protein
MPAIFHRVVVQCAKKARLTRVAFNPRYPILLIGDSKGDVSAYKLSPNLRKNVKVDDKSGARLEVLERQEPGASRVRIGSGLLTHTQCICIGSGAPTGVL